MTSLFYAPDVSIPMSKNLEKVGEVTHYYTKIGVAVVKLTGPLRVGEEIAVKGMTTDFEQRVGSMQIEHEQVQQAKKGDMIGLKVEDYARKGDIVYRLV